MIITILPGDLVEFVGRTGIYLITSIERRSFSWFKAATETNPIFSSKDQDAWGRVLPNELSYGRSEFDPYGRLKIKSIKRLFDFNIYRSPVCNDLICYPRRLNGECSGCPLGSLSTGRIRNLYLPGDYVWLPREKREAEVTEMCLSLKPVYARLPGVFVNFKSVDSASWNRGSVGSYRMQSLIDLFFDSWPDINLVGIWELLKEGTYFTSSPRYYVNEEKSGRWGEDIRIKDRGYNTYLKKEDVDMICNICIFQGGDKCGKCTVENFRTKNI